MLLAQLSRLEEQTDHRERNAKMLDHALTAIPGVSIQKCDPRITRRGVHLYIFRFLPEQWDGVSRSQFLEAAAAEGLALSAGYPIPLYQMPVFTRQSDKYCDIEATARPYPANIIDYRDVHCPNAERMCREAVWIVQAQMLGDTADMQDIIDVITKLWEHRLELRER